VLASYWYLGKRFVSQLLGKQPTRLMRYTDDIKKVETVNIFRLRQNSVLSFIFYKFFTFRGIEFE